MKTRHFFLLIGIVLLFLHAGIARAQSYEFSLPGGTYTALDQAEQLSADSTWDDETWTLDLGFDFPVFDYTVNEVYISQGVLVFTDPDTNRWQNAVVYVCTADLVDRGDNGVTSSPVSYQVDGSAPARICKIEWSNAGFYADEDAEEYLNLQVWLYEETGDIEVRFGPNLVSEASYDEVSGPLVGIVQYDEFQTEILDGFTLGGEPSNPNAQENSVDFLSGTPDSGVVYRFAKL